MIFSISSPQEVGNAIAKQAQARRLSLDLSQKTLSDRSGVSLGVIKKFERSGKISLESLLKLALVLESLQGFESLFSSANNINRILSLDHLLKDKKRKRGRQ